MEMIDLSRLEPQETLNHTVSIFQTLTGKSNS